MEEKLKERLVPIVEDCLRQSSCFRDAYLNNPQGQSLAQVLSETGFMDKMIDLLKKTFVVIFQLLKEEGLLEEKPYLRINPESGADTGIAIFHKGRLIFSKFINALSLNPANPTKKEEFTRTASSWASDIRNGVRNGHRPRRDEEMEYEEEDEYPWWMR